MSTNSVIARATDPERGVYVHFDGYPSGVGADLVTIIRSTFNGDVEAALKVLVDESPQGWSNLDPSLKGDGDDVGQHKVRVAGVGERYNPRDATMIQHVENQSYGYAIHPDGRIDVYDYNGRAPHEDLSATDPPETITVTYAVKLNPGIITPGEFENLLTGLEGVVRVAQVDMEDR